MAVSKTLGDGSINKMSRSGGLGEREEICRQGHCSTFPPTLNLETDREAGVESGVEKEKLGEERRCYVEGVASAGYRSRAMKAGLDRPTT